MKKLIFGSVALAILSVSAPTFADGYYKDYKDVVPCCSFWSSGFYGGLNFGYGWGSQSISTSGSTIGGTTSMASAVNDGAIPSSMAGSPSGWLGGPQIGYNYMWNDASIIGIEADYDWANIEDSQNTTTHQAPAHFDFTTNGKQEVDSLGTVRARIGWLPSGYPVLLFLTGGWAYGHVEMSSSVTNPGCEGFCGSNSTSGNNSGWVLGAGAEYAFNCNWSAKLEYMYYDLGSLSQKIKDPVFPSSFLAQSVDFKGNVVRAGINYKFM